MVALRKGNYMYKLGKRETILDFNFSHQWIDREKTVLANFESSKEKKTETKIIFYIPYSSLTNSDDKYYTFLQKQITYR